MSLYATKRSLELMAYAYAILQGIASTGLWYFRGSGHGLIGHGDDSVHVKIIGMSQHRFLRGTTSAQSCI